MAHTHHIDIIYAFKGFAFEFEHCIIIYKITR